MAEVPKHVHTAGIQPGVSVLLLVPLRNEQPLASRIRYAYLLGTPDLDTGRYKVGGAQVNHAALLAPVAR